VQRAGGSLSTDQRMSASLFAFVQRCQTAASIAAFRSLLSAPMLPLVHSRVLPRSKPKAHRKEVRQCPVRVRTRPRLTDISCRPRQLPTSYANCCSKSGKDLPRGSPGEYAKQASACVRSCLPIVLLAAPSNPRCHYLG
jgi:hypothetical protein